MSQPGIQAAVTLFNERKMESRRVRYGLYVVRDVATVIEDEIAVIEGNGRMLPLRKIWNCVFEGASEIGILCRAAVPSKPARVYGQLLQVGKPPFLRDSGNLAGRQNGKVIQIDSPRAL